MAKRPELRPEPIECARCGKRIGKTIKAYEIAGFDGLCCRACEHDAKLIDFDEAKAIARVRERIRAGWRIDRIPADLRNWMRPPTHDRYWERAGYWNDMDVHDYRTRHWSWAR